jgi:hypothetical protein
VCYSERASPRRERAEWILPGTNSSKKERRDSKGKKQKGKNRVKQGVRREAKDKR